jgi:predicted RNA binding protein YcfA (HicA-like mRNA interferase family)
VSRKKKRLEQMRRNKRNVSYSDFVGVLGEYGYSIRTGKGSHRVASVDIDDTTIVEVHEGKFMHHKDVERLLKQISQIEALQAEEDGDEDE